MKPQPNALFLAFTGTTRIASGRIEDVAKVAKSIVDNDPGVNVLVFDSCTSKLVELDLRGTADDVVDRYVSQLPVDGDKKTGPGRPKLGVVPREVTLLPRHWEWLATQPGGASSTLRRLVEEARKKGGTKEQVRQAQGVTYEFMRVMAGDLVGYENALRALYAGRKDEFTGLVAGWPSDIRAHVLQLARPSFATDEIDLRCFLPHSQFGEIQHIERINIGHSGAAVYSVSTASGDFVLRLHGENQAAWNKSVMLQRLASDNKISPALKYISETERAAVSIKVNGVSFGAAISRPSSRTAAFASLTQTLQKLHSISVPNLTSLDPAKFARSVWEEQAMRPGFPKWAAHLGERIPELERVTESDTRKVLSHGDLNPANILWDGQQIWLVDWEAAGMAHPYLDLATIANFLALPDEAALRLLAQQEPAPIEVYQRGVFAAFRELTRIVYGGVFLRLVPDLTAVIFPERQETPALGECFAMIASGEYAASHPQWLTWVAAAMLKQCHAP